MTNVFIMTTNLDFLSLQSRNRDAANKFYGELLGFEKLPTPNPVATVYKDGAGAIFAVREPFAPLPDNAQLGLGVGIWFTVPGALADWETKLHVAGVPILKSAYPTPFGTALTVADPDGYAITLHETVPAND